MTSESNLFYEEERAENKAAADALERRERTRVVSRLRSLAMEMEFIGENYMGLLNEVQAGSYHNATDAITKLVAELDGRGIMSFKAEVIADNSGKWTGNACRFATHGEAASYVRDLSYRWTSVKDTRVVESGDTVNYRFVEGRAVPFIVATGDHHEEA